MEEPLSTEEPTLSQRLAAVEHSNARAAYRASKAATLRHPRFAPRTAAKRANSDRPREISSRHPVPVGREACLGINKETKRKCWDPRFQEHTGKVRENQIDEDYAFVEEWRKEEIAKAEKELKKKPRDKRLVRKVEEMKLEARKMREGRRAREVKIEALEKEREKVRMGKKPFYPNAKALKELEFKSKYEELKRAGRLQKFINKRRKRRTAKDRRLLPQR